MDFYMVLPSNASPQVYPENKTSNYKIQLSERVELHGEWEVALMEFHYPNTIQQVSEGENVVHMTHPGGKTETYRLHTGHYITKENLLAGLQKALAPLEQYSQDTAPNILDKYDTGDEKHDENHEFGEAGPSVVEITENGCILFHPFQKAPGAYFTFSTRLAMQLGLLHPGPYSTQYEHSGTYPIDTSLGMTPQMYVYLDIIEDQIVGHTRAPLLRTVPVETRKAHGGMTSYRCEPPIYFKLKTKSFDTLEVNIRTHTGQFVPFDHGTSTLLCHFKQRA